MDKLRQHQQQDGLSSIQVVDRRSKYVGVTWHRQDQKWQVAIKVSGKSRHLGHFSSEEEAAQKYDQAAAPLGRKVNFPELLVAQHQHRQQQGGGNNNGASSSSLGGSSSCSSSPSAAVVTMGRAEKKKETLSRRLPRDEVELPPSSSRRPSRCDVVFKAVVSIGGSVDDGVVAWRLLYVYYMYVYAMSLDALLDSLLIV
jgi:hypothetical protein